MTVQASASPTFMPRAIRFGLVGALVLAVDLGVIGLLKPWLSPLATVSVAYAVAVSVHFLLNKCWVFRCESRAWAGQIIRYLLNLVACWLCTVASVSLALHALTSNLYVAKFVALPPTTLLGFLIMRFFVFPSAPADATSTPRTSCKTPEEHPAERSCGR